MIENMERKDTVFFVKVSGHITKEDVNYVAPVIEKRIQEYKRIKLFVQLNDVKGYTFSGFIADLMLYFKYMNAFNDMAIVSNNGIFKDSIKKFNKIFPCNVKYFDISKFEEAENWINQA